ncbi:hypothetical protein FRC18_000455 [Serendipita sp. 400]|nr:hypothetical protein FRC18_000455 [Serendipita sp. 400]
MAGILTNQYWKDQFGHPGPDAQGGIVASMPAGSLVGALAVGKLADILGRKLTIQISGVIWVIGSILQCASVNRGMLVVGRIIAGMAVGIASATVPLYQGEITAARIRGRMISLQQWSITWGILLQYFVQFGCSYIEGKASFRIPWGVQVGCLSTSRPVAHLVADDSGYHPQCRNDVVPGVSSLANRSWTRR